MPQSCYNRIPRSILLLKLQLRQLVRRKQRRCKNSGSQSGGSLNLTGKGIEGRPLSAEILSHLHRSPQMQMQQFVFSAPAPCRHSRQRERRYSTNMRENTTIIQTPIKAIAQLALQDTYDVTPSITTSSYRHGF
jgi:hypothetical protein